MALALWKDLCLDASDATLLGQFWAAVLALRVEQQEGGDVVLRGKHPEQTIWINQVPEKKSVKNRVHLDLVRADVGPLPALGAAILYEVVDGSYRWQVLADPEGNEFCVFDARQDEPTALVVDSAEPTAAARWWADMLGGRLLLAPGDELRWVGDVPALPFDVMKFVGVPEPKTVKNRMHWDVQRDDIAPLLARGARVLRVPDGDVHWHVLADPQGNEFCAFTP